MQHTDSTSLLVGADGAILNRGTYEECTAIAKKAAEEEGLITYVMIPAWKFEPNTNPVKATQLVAGIELPTKPVPLTPTVVP